MQFFHQAIGNTKTHAIALRWNDVAFDATGMLLLFGMRRPGEGNADVVNKSATGVTGSTWELDITDLESAVSDGVYEWDVVAADTTEVIRVAQGQMLLDKGTSDVVPANALTFEGEFVYFEGELVTLDA